MRDLFCPVPILTFDSHGPSTCTVCNALVQARADEREQAAQRVNGCRADLRGYVAKATAIAAILAIDETRPLWTTPADVNKWAARGEDEK